MLLNLGGTWRIIPVSDWLGSPPFISHLTHLEGEYPYWGDLLTMVINHLLNGMILQVAPNRTLFRNKFDRYPHVKIAPLQALPGRRCEDTRVAEVFFGQQLKHHFSGQKQPLKLKKTLKDQLKEANELRITKALPRLDRWPRMNMCTWQCTCMQYINKLPYPCFFWAVMTYDSWLWNHMSHETNLSCLGYIGN